jgi:hypothetical protein
MKKSLIILLFSVLLLIIPSMTFASEGSTWEVKLNENKNFSTKGKPYKSYDLKIFNKGNTTRNVTLEVYRPINNEKNSTKVVLFDPFISNVKVNDSIDLKNFYIKKATENIEVNILWEEDNRKHKQSYTIDIK